MLEGRTEITMMVQPMGLNAPIARYTTAPVKYEIMVARRAMAS
jgi:hypothetical protein